MKIKIEDVFVAILVAYVVIASLIFIYLIF